VQRGIRPHSARWLLWVGPAVALTGLFVVYPAIQAVRYSFLSWPGYGPQRSAGLQNFRAFFNDAAGLRAIEHSVIFATFVSVGAVLAGTLIAIALDRRIFGYRTFGFLIFLPVLLPTTFIGVAWANGYDEYTGWVNAILGPVGLSHPYLSDPRTVLYAIAAAAILAGTGFPMAIILSALGEIPADLHEAATLDGASELQRARYISLPLVRDAIATVVLIELIFGLGQFDLVYVMTDGGPGTRSEVMSTYVYHQAFADHRFGYAAAASLLMSLVVAALALVYVAIHRPGRIEVANA
jgi:raffinose/stachyose/melibiose transport system permease protein